MIFGDYAPPSSPSRDQQRDALQKGLGRAVQWAMTGRLDDEPLLEACLQDQRFDWLVDEVRGEWLWEIVQAAGAADRFRVPILHALYELDEECGAYQLCKLAQCYGQVGDDAFRSRLYEIVEQKPFPDDWSNLGEEEIIALDGEQAFLFAARLRGASLADREWGWEDDSLLQFAIKRFGESRVSDLLEASSDAAVRRFLDGWRSDELRKAGPKQPDTYSERMAAISVAEIIRAAEGESKRSLFRGWGRLAGEADLRLVLQRLRTERQPQVLVKLLQVFSARPLPDFDARLIELCKHDSEEVRRRAFGVLEQNSHPLIRDFALTELRGGLRHGGLAGLFINNYRPGDEQRLLEALELPTDAGELHWLLMDIVELFEKNANADCSRLGIICYVSNPCEYCRFRSVRLLLKQQAAPQWLTEECGHDSSEECRELFTKVAGSTEAR
jgi:hypothetical protein